MKKMTRLLALILALSMLSTVMVGAAEANPQGAYVLPDYSGAALVFQDAEKNAITDTYTKTENGVEVTVYPEPARVSVTLDADDGVVAGQQYVVFLLGGGGDAGNTVPGEKNIRYIDQVGSNSTTVSFNLYPDMLTTAGEYNIYVTSDDGEFTIAEPVATFYVTEKPGPVPHLGDVYIDGIIDSRDALEILKSVVDLITLNEQQLVNANTLYSDDVIDSRDALQILKYDVGLLDKF